MGNVATAFTAAFPLANNVDPAACQALGGTIETQYAAPFSGWSLNATAVASLPAPPAGWIARICGADAANARYLVDAFAGVPSLTLRRANGTGASPSAIQSGNVIARIDAFGYGATGMSSSGRANWEARATQNWTDTAQGVKWVVEVTPNGAFAAQDAFTIHEKGVDVVGSIKATGGMQTSAPATKTGNYSQVETDHWLIFNASGSATLTLLSAANYPGKELWVKTIAAQAVNSASSNVSPVAGGASGTAILAATAGKWALLVSDGATTWHIMAGN